MDEIEKKRIREKLRKGELLTLDEISFYLAAMGVEDRTHKPRNNS